MSHKCPTYSNIVEELFCSRRYKKAIDNPMDEVLSACRTCNKGAAAYESLSAGPTVKQSPSFNRVKPRKQDVGPKKEKIMSNSKTWTGHKKCKHPEGCEKKAWKEGLCYHHFFVVNPKAKRPASGKVQKKPRTTEEKLQEKLKELAAEVKTRGVPYLTEAIESLKQTDKLYAKPAEPGEMDNCKKAVFGELLYASELLDGQIESILDNGLVDTNVLVDIRNRIGLVLRTSLPVSEIIHAAA
ncbi:MAG: hypothetical protein WC769_01680 [Thermodesulfovibrionales bacterium]|jgi:hypothetical protein